MIAEFGQNNLFIMLSKRKRNNFQEYFLKYIITNFKNVGITYTIKYCNEFPNDDEFAGIGDLDFILWEPIVAYWNIDFLNSHLNSIVVLKNPTLLLQKISDKNPINESLAINHGFQILYMDPEDNDLSNDEWRLVVNRSNFTISIEKLRQLIKPLVKEKFEYEIGKTMRTNTIGENQVNLSDFVEQDINI